MIFYSKAKIKIQFYSFHFFLKNFLEINCVSHTESSLVSSHFSEKNRKRKN
jgi:hypothetical protein